MLHSNRGKTLLAACLTLTLAGVGCTGTTSDRRGSSGGTGGSAGRNVNGGATANLGGSAGGSGGTGGDVTPVIPFEALPPRVYAAKVKNLLTGLPLGDAELAAVEADPGALKGQIDEWMKRPEFSVRMMDFFKQAFQQTQLDITDFEDTLRAASQFISADRARFVKAVEESFARTMLALVAEGRPFTEALTGNRFMLNVPLMVSLGYIDAAPMDDLSKPVPSGFWLLQKYPTFQYQMVVVPDAASMIPLSETLDPKSPKFMMWSATQPPTANKTCMDLQAKGPTAIQRTFVSLFGFRPNGCSQQPVFTDADWNDWRMITVRKPKAGEERTVFFDLGRLRDTATKELVLSTPRVGFMTTLAFFANWPTNDSNMYRVTTNQALIVALGTSFDDRGTTVPVTENASDAMHVEPGTACYGCHITLDPMRDFFRQSYSLTYFEQLGGSDPKKPVEIPARGTFTVNNSDAVSGTGIATLAGAMAGHDLFAPAWVQKICQFANASSCDPDDPEFRRVVDVWKKSQFDFKVLLRETLSSPLVTFAARTQTADMAGVVLSIARRDAFCTRLESRLKLRDVCNMRGETALPKVATSARNLSMGIPGSGYARGDDKPLLPHDPNMFFTAGTEKLCALLSTQLVDTPTGPWKSTDKDTAIKEFVVTLAGIPAADARSAAMVDVLTRHYQAALTAKEKPADALRSTFTLACAAPMAVSSGL